jgi:hypothetical protein
MDVRSMSADSTPPMPEQQSYTYPGALISQVIGLLAILVGLFFIGLGIYDSDKGAWIGILIGAIWTWGFFNGVRGSFINQRPLVVDANGITARAFGKPWKFIAWPDITRIARIRRMMILELGGSRNGYEFVIYGPHVEINLDDRISNFPVLLNTLNSYVQRYQIPLSARDRGSDTQDQIKATVKDKQERKKLLKEGMQSSITSL